MGFKWLKVCGLDDLPLGMLKDCCEHIYQPLCHIINLSIGTNKIPSAWKIAKVVQVYKKGPSGDPENYRPISVPPILSKILEKAIHQQLLRHLDEQSILTEYRFGYRPQRSTNLAATLFVDNIRKEVDCGSLVGDVFIDLCKAFDILSHSTLLSKLLDIA